MKRNLLLLLILISLQAFAQSPEIRARAAFMDAQEQYGNGNFGEAIKQLNAVKELLGSTNPRVEYLLAQSYMGADQPDKAEINLKKYFELADEADPNYNAMLLMIKQIAQQKEEFRKEQERIAYEKEMAAMEAEVWLETKKTDTREAYQTFIDTYPQGEYVVDANKALRKFPPAKLVDSRTGYSYKTVWIGNQVWMASNLLNPGDRTDYIHYNERMSICPEGWRLPTLRDYERMLTAAGADLSKGKTQELGSDSFYKGYGKQVEPFFEKLALSVQDDKKWQGSNESGFSALPKPSIGGSFFSLGKNKGVFWTTNGYIIIAPKGGFGIVIFGSSYSGPSLKAKMPCRCVKDE